MVYLGLYSFNSSDYLSRVYELFRLFLVSNMVLNIFSNLLVLIKV